MLSSWSSFMLYVYFLHWGLQSVSWCRYYAHSDNSQIYNSVLICLLKLIFLYSARVYSIYLLGCLIDIWNSTCLQLNSNLCLSLNWNDPFDLQPSHSVTDNCFSVAQVKSSGIILDSILSFTLFIQSFRKPHWFQLPNKSSILLPPVPSYHQLLPHFLNSL